jgi:flagellin-like protein
MNYRKIRKNIKAISPIISVLLMIAIAVVASLVVYAWVMGYIGYQTGKTGDSVVVQSVSWNPDTASAGSSPTAIYLQDIGSTTIAANPTAQLYINGALVTSAVTPTGGLAPGSTWTITPSGLTTTQYPQGSTITIKVTTAGGTYSQVNEQVP